MNTHLRVLIPPRRFRTGERARIGLASVCAGALAIAALGLPPRAAEAQGVERRPDYEPAAFAITNATVWSAPGRVLEEATVLLRDGVIEAVGAADEIETPYDAEVIDGEGLVVYPGFLDLFTTIGEDDSVPRSETGLSRPIPLDEVPLASTPPDNRNGLTPEFRIAEALKLSEDATARRRALGFTALLSAPDGAIATGQSALVNLSDLGRRESLIAEPIALHIRLANPRGRQYGDLQALDALRFEALAGLHDHSHDQGHCACEWTEAMAEAGPPDSGGYPGALMGVIAHLRQAMLDSEYHHRLKEYAQMKGGSPPPFDPALEALHQARTGELSVWWRADSREEIHRALDLAEEFGTNAVIVGGREAHEVVDRLAERDVPVVLTLDFPEEPEVPTLEDYLEKDVKDRDRPFRGLQKAHEEWRERVEVARALAEADVPFAFSTDGLSRTNTALEKIRTVIEAGLPEETAIAALTLEAARIAGVGKRLGTIEPGKLGDLVVWSGPLASEDAKPRFVFVAGRKFEIEEDERGRGRRGREAAEDDEEEAEIEEPEAAILIDWPVAEEADWEEAVFKPIQDALQSIEAIEEIEASLEEETVRIEVELDDATEDPESVWAEIRERLDAVENLPKGASKPRLVPLSEVEYEKEDEDEAEPDEEEAEAEEEEPAKAADFEDIATEFDEDREPTIQTGGDVLIEGATILTVANGTIEDGSILIRDGKIEAVGTEVEAPEGVLKIDAREMVALPGIIDTHSHMAISGGVNEGSLSIVPEVRVKDVVTGDDTTIYRAAAGGVTAARLLHGSANTIGGQDAVIKLKYGQPARELIIQDGPQGIKFALGENVTRKRSSDPDRFPFTRPGVEAVIVRAFEEAKHYEEQRRAYADAVAQGEEPPPFRRDLRLEAIADILGGDILIHSHSYRADEILMLLRTAERYGIRVQSLQHVLEGYKIAAEIAAHGASSSTFSDWWAYKVEAYDAIPHNAALITEAGGNVCIKSDSGEEIRHLYMEAAKMVRYGGASETEALAMVTLNPARELGLDHRLGSIEVGKDADIALFNAHPLDGFAQCQLTLVDGEVVFQRHREEDGPPLQPRDGDHSTMPQVPEEQRALALEIPEDPDGRYALVNATVHPVTGPVIEQGTLVIADGKLEALGGPETNVPEGVTTVDLGGLDVWPGMIDAGTTVGLTEIGSVSATQDARELAPYQPELRASVAIHPDSAIIATNRVAGVLSAFVRPTGGTISGQGALVDLAGWTWPEMVQQDEFALYVNVPPAPPSDLEERLRRIPQQYVERIRQRYENREERLEELKERFRQAKRFGEILDEARSRGDTPPVDPRLEALVPYARGEKPVVFSADGRGEILTALELAEDLGLKAILSGGGDAWKIADVIKEADVPILITGTHRSPGGDEPYDAPYANPAKLHEAGVTFAISSSGSATESRNLPFEAAMAVAYGLPEVEGLKAVTLYPAQILGVSDELGSLEPGKRANLVISAGHLLQPTTEVKHLFVGGRPIPPTSRQTELYERYRKRLEAVQNGRSPLALERSGEERLEEDADTTVGATAAPAEAEAESKVKAADAATNDER